MKLSQLSTDRTLDVLCEITPYISNIMTDKAILDVFAKKMDTKKMTIMSVKIVSASRYNKMLSLILKYHRTDIYGILAVVNQKTQEEIAAQPLLETMQQIQEVFQDEELLAFFKSFAPQGKNAPSAPYANSPA